MYDTNFFTQELETFSALTFLSDGFHIISPSKLKMLPYFKNRFYEFPKIQILLKDGLKK